jgi:hypothetical protein
MITEARFEEYKKARDDNLRHSKNYDYIRSTTAHYETIQKLDSAYNRIFVYKSCQLHSGMIPSNMPFSADPEEGRLTANIFVTYREV